LNSILYLSLTGITEPLGRSQVLEYLIDLSHRNKIYLITFERSSDLKSIEEVKKLTKLNNITWSHYVYSNKYGIFSTIWQILNVVYCGSNVIKKHNIKVIHSRSFVPAIIGVVLKKIHNIKLLFDIRGFAIDEKVDSGRISQKGVLYKILKKIDNSLYKSADHIVTLTHKSKELLSSKRIDMNKITVIPTCANKNIFKVINNVEKNIFRNSIGYRENDKIIIHCGTVSGWYDFENEVKLVKEIMKIRSNVHFLIVNNKEHSFISKTIEKHHLNNRVKIISVCFEEMYKYLNIADISIFFITPSYSKLASAPTKFAENIACHLPSISNTEVGDMDFYFQNYNVGCLVDLKKIDENLLTISQNIVKMLDNDSDKYVDDFNIIFNNFFDKNIAVSKYQSIYDSLHFD